MTSKALILLERLQEREYARIGTLAERLQGASSADQNIENKILEEVLKARAAFIAPGETDELRKSLIEHVRAIQVPTKFEDPLQYSMMRSAADQIERAVSDLKFLLPVHPQIGTLPTGQVNAKAIMLPDSNEYLILFESELLTFVLLLSKVVARATPFKRSNSSGRLAFSTAKDDWVRTLREQPEILFRFQEVMLAYLLVGRPSAATQYVLEEPYGSLAMNLRRSMVLFVLGHEYGHIIDGHFSRLRVSSVDAEDNRRQIVLQNWRREFEADVKGLDLMATAMQTDGVDITLSYSGADFFFSCLEIVEQGIAILRTGKIIKYAASDSHPTAWMRREKLRKAVNNSLPPEVASAAIQLGTIVEQIMAALWTLTIPILQERYKAGERPSNIWDLSNFRDAHPYRVSNS
jgi:hypothetical protein